MTTLTTNKKYIIIFIVVLIVFLIAEYFFLKSKFNTTVIINNSVDTIYNKKLDSLILISNDLNQKLIKLEEEKQNTQNSIIKKYYINEKEISNINNISPDSNFIWIKKYLNQSR